MFAACRQYYGIGGPTTGTFYACKEDLDVGGTCTADPDQPCAPFPTPAPTPPPTPPLKYRCDNSTGDCVLNPLGAQTASQCEGNCVCAIPHNCGQLNGTYVCGKKINACNVCDECCEFYVLPQANCNECVAQAAPPAGKGCGWPNMTDLFQLART